MEKINWSIVDNNINYLTFNNEVLKGKVVDVYDGDSIKLVLPFIIKRGVSKYKILNNFFKSSDIIQLYKWNCRLTGLDTPEIRTRNLKEKEFGLEVRDKLREKILNNLLFVKCGVFDKYGRLLVTLYDSDENLKKDYSINQWLIDNKYAKEYNGGKKQQWFAEKNEL